MNDSEKFSEIYCNLVDISSRLSVLQCMDTEMLNFPDCSNNGSHKTVVTGVTIITKDIREKIEEIFKLIDM